MSFEKHSETLQGTRFSWCTSSRAFYLVALEIVKFREMLEDRIARQAGGLPVLPEEYKPVIAKLAHERCLFFFFYRHHL